MTRTTRHQPARAAVVVAVLAWTSPAAASEVATAAAPQPALMAPDARVRGVGTRMVAVINEAGAHSQTFRGLVARIGDTDGIVYVAEGPCGHGVQACLLDTMTLAGSNRVLRILIDPGKSDRDRMGSIGHELQHAVEVLSHRNVRSSSAITLLYLNHAGLKNGNRFETYAAIEAGNAVRTELRDTLGACCP